MQGDAEVHAEMFGGVFKGEDFCRGAIFKGFAF